jgi:hypothetical protein
MPVHGKKYFEGQTAHTQNQHAALETETAFQGTKIAGNRKI